MTSYSAGLGVKSCSPETKHRSSFDPSGKAENSFFACSIKLPFSSTMSTLSKSGKNKCLDIRPMPAPQSNTRPVPTRPPDDFRKGRRKFFELKFNDEKWHFKFFLRIQPFPLSIVYYLLLNEVKTFLSPVNIDRRNALISAQHALVICWNIGPVLDRIIVKLKIKD